MSDESVNPDAMIIALLKKQTALLGKMSNRLDGIEKLMQDEHGHGLLEPVSVNVTDQPVHIEVPDDWISCVIKNGSKPVYPFMNRLSATREAPLAASEDLTVDLHAHEVKDIYLVCDAGDTSTVRLYGLR